MNKNKNKMELMNYEILFINYCENFIDGSEKICGVCELKDTHCEGRRCDESYDLYLERLKHKEVVKEINTDFDFRNKHNNLSLKNKLKFKNYIEN